MEAKDLYKAMTIERSNCWPAACNPIDNKAPPNKFFEQILLSSATTEIGHMLLFIISSLVTRQTERMVMEPTSSMITRSRQKERVKRMPERLSH